MRLRAPAKRWRIVLGLAVLAPAIGFAQPAGGQVDLTQVELSVAIDRMNGVSRASFVASLVVRGAEIRSATITPPGLAPLALVERPSGEFVRELSFEDEAGLNAALPDGDYVLELNQGEVVATVPYVRPVVPAPAPAVRLPVNSPVLPPGPVECFFTPCTICVQSGDSTVATLEREGMEPVSETLPGGAASWVPTVMGVPLALAAQSDFSCRVEHSASRPSALFADPSDPFTFENAFSHAGEVDFSTGFSPFEGDVCIVVNDPTNAIHGPSDGCTEHADLQDGILDTGGTFSTTAAGVPLRYGYSVNPRGRLFGMAAADLDGDGSFETLVPLAGRLQGENGSVRENVRIAIRGTAPPAKLNVRIREQTDTITSLRTRTQTTKGRLLGARVFETTTTTESIGAQPRGWRLDFSISGAQGEISDAEFMLSNGRTAQLFGRHRFLSDVDRSNVRLKSEGGDRGVGVEIDALALDAAGSIVRGELRYRAFGQEGTIRFR